MSDAAVIPSANSSMDWRGASMAERDESADRSLAIHPRTLRLLTGGAAEQPAASCPAAALCSSLTSATLWISSSRITSPDAQWHAPVEPEGTAAAMAPNEDDKRTERAAPDEGAEERTEERCATQIIEHSNTQMSAVHWPKELPLAQRKKEQKGNPALERWESNRHSERRESRRPHCAPPRIPPELAAQRESQVQGEPGRWAPGVHLYPLVAFSNRLAQKSCT